MTQETVQTLPGLRANPVTVREEKAERPVLVLSKGNRVEMLADLKGGRVSRIRILSPTYSARGVKIGDRAKRLNTLFGPGVIAKDGGEIAVRFKKAPGFAFGFSPGSEPVKSWPEAVKKGLNLTSILIEGR